MLGTLALCMQVQKRAKILANFAFRSRLSGDFLRQRNVSPPTTRSYTARGMRMLR